jgi:hypothetical protein
MTTITLGIGPYCKTIHDAVGRAYDITFECHPAAPEVGQDNPYLDIIAIDDNAVSIDEDWMYDRLQKILHEEKDSAKIEQYLTEEKYGGQ